MKKGLEDLFETLNELMKYYKPESPNLKEIISAMFLIISNEDKDKYDKLCELITDFNWEQIQYSILGNNSTRILHVNDKFMWLLRYGLCNGDDEKCMEVYELITNQKVKV